MVSRRGMLRSLALVAMAAVAPFPKAEIITTGLKTMPTINGKYLHWWHWTAKDPDNGKSVIIFTDGGPGIATKEQLLVVVQKLFPFLDYSSFTAELTEKIGEAFQRKPVPQKYVANPWQREMHEILSPPETPLAQRSILYGTREPEKRQHHAPQRSGGVSKLYG